MKIIIITICALFFIFFGFSCWLYSRYRFKRSIVLENERFLSTDDFKPLPKNASKELRELMDEA
jgi:hypothetical protein